LEVERVYSSAEWVVLGEGEGASGSPEGAGIELAGSSWDHSQSADVSEAVAGIVESPGD